MEKPVTNKFLTYESIELLFEISRRNADDANVTIIDGSALLLTIHWPADGSISDLIGNVKTRLTSYRQRVMSTSSSTGTIQNQVSQQRC